jgi:hypothetical protein
MKMGKFNFLVLLTFLVQSFNSYADDADLSKHCEKAANAIAHLENVVGFKLHGFAKYSSSERDVDQEVWIEGRNGKIWCQTLNVENKNNPVVVNELRYAEIVGADRKITKIFDGKKSIEHKPILMLVRIDDADKFIGPGATRYLNPMCWTNFGQRDMAAKFSYRYVLENSLEGRSIRWQSRDNKIRVSYENPSSKALLKSKWLEFSLSNYLVTASSESGVALSNTCEYEWALSEGSWYVSKGKVQVGDKEKFEWTIDSYTSDAKKVRSNFALEDSKLPLGTRIETDPQSKRGTRNIRFVGGADGQREHDLRQAALKIVQQKDGNDK